MRLKLFILLLLYSCFILPQKLTDHYLYALKLYNHEDYFNCITECKRLSFFDTSKTLAWETNYLTGLAYKNGGFYSNAIEYFSYSIKEDTVWYKIYTSKKEIARCNILRNQYEHALRLLDDLQKQYSINKKETSYWKGWTLLFLKRFEEASDEFKISGDTLLSSYALKINEEFYSKNLIKGLSYILPGTGQIITGNYVNGAIALTYHALFGYLTIKAFEEKREFDGLMIGNFLWFRFYRGNIENTERFVDYENQQIFEKYLSKIYEDQNILKP